MRAVARALFALTALVLLGAAAADPADRLADPGQEAHARALFKDVRCLVCQSESIDESDAPLAHDLRQLIRAQVSQGRTDDQIRAFLVARYGQFVLLTPEASLGNAILWGGPALVIVLGAVAFTARRRRAETPEASALSAEEEAELSAYCSDDEG